MSRKNHVMTDRGLLQTDKKFSALKERQKTKIAEWMYKAYRNCYVESGRIPQKGKEYEVLSYVFQKIEDAGIWIPDEEEINRYNRMLVSLYEDYKEGIVDKKDFQLIKENFEQKKTVAEQAIRNIEKEAETAAQERDSDRSWMEEYRENRNISSLTCFSDQSHNLAKRFWNKTVPVLFNELIWGGGFTIYSVIMGHMGTDAVAANGVANISKNLIVCLCLGLGSAGSIIIGNRLGANLFEEAKQAGKTLTKISLLCGVLSGIILLALYPVIIRFAGLTPQAGEYLRGMLVISSYYLAGKSINSMTIGGIFPAGGDSRFGLLCDAVTLWCITIPIGCLCAFILKLPVLMVYFVLNLDEIVKLPVVYCHYKKYKWLKNLTNGGTQNE